jgi:ubiquinone/menaquinone biosynthesis C-methylase UbiE
MEKKKELKLDLACGQKKQPGFTGVDKTQVDGVDIICDLEKFPWPFEDNSVDEVICRHYIEHTPDMIAFMDEIYRILKPGHDCTIVAPYYTSIDAWRDPTHRRAISEESFRYFNKKWREEAKVDHYGIKADFMFTHEFVLVPEWKMRSEEARKFAIRHYHNVVSEIKVTLTKNFVIPEVCPYSDG